MLQFVNLSTLTGRLLQFTFVEDHFMIPDDPLGKDGPHLDIFLRKDSWCVMKYWGHVGSVLVTVLCTAPSYTLFLFLSGELRARLRLSDPRTSVLPHSSSQFTCKLFTLPRGPPPPWRPTPLRTGPTLGPQNGTHLAVLPHPLPHLHPSGRRGRHQSWRENCTTSSPTRSSGSTASSATTRTWETWTPFLGCCSDKELSQLWGSADIRAVHIYKNNLFYHLFQLGGLFFFFFF